MCVQKGGRGGREGVLKWQCQSDFCPTQIISLIDGLEIGLKGLVPPPPSTDINAERRLQVLVSLSPLGMEVRSRSGAEQAGTAAIKTLRSLVRYSSYISSTLTASILHEL